MAKIGFIGTGIMGMPMALNLIKAGHSLNVWNRSTQKLKILADAGATICPDLTEIGIDSDILICMLNDGPTCDEILFSKNGAVSQLKAGSTVIVMSSIPVQTAQAQAKKCHSLGLHYLDAPVSGGEKGAQQATLAIMAGGETEHFEQVKDILKAMGRPTLVGAAGCGELAKLVNQLIVATTIATISEGLLLAQQGGADPRKVKEALTGGFADSNILQQHGERILNNQFTPGGPAKWQLKDTRTALDYAETVNLQLPVARIVDQLFADMVDAGDGELDHAGLIRQLKRINHLKI
ncbi:NAD(P)-dependent oxidoreductase [Acinetobacter sp. MD2(2019)]|uniref:NAD(P)-dependent oxidoreductase n=1 Tax=Acinetobacter sp. MD2(2019) TaxID=2605273 RepID=UPI002D1ECA38|nr:NAD(P)-dependent oxidoreductase [Acinetobacter sp. MD2(2019)]MEB3752766.1 NAD(P)-dependent oxidoreductase [Acinetobacter sp. MD2(2019)]